MADAGALAPALAADLEAQLPAMLEATERMVAIDSGSHDTAGVRAVAEQVAALLRPAGFDCEWMEVAGSAPLLRAELHADAPRRLLVLGHADTVWPSGTAAEWPFHRSGERIRGPGVGDMKSCLVMACFALAALVQRGLLDGTAVSFLVVPDEELGSVGSRAEVERAAGTADACLCLEAAAPDGSLVDARGAVGAMVVRATGRSAHVTDRPPGAGALAPLAALVGPLEALGDRAGGAAVTAGILRAGSARQVVPERGELHLDLRAPDAATAAALEAQVRELVDRVSADGVVLAAEGGITRPAWPRSAAGDRLAEIAGAAAAALGDEVDFRAERGGSDASFAGALGVPTLDGLGPVCHDSCSRAESVEIASIARRGAVFAALAATAVS